MASSDERKPAKRRVTPDRRRVSARDERFLVKIVPVDDVWRVSTATATATATAAKRDPDSVASRVARRQLNLITTGQLHAAGVGDAAITRRQKKATLHRVHQAVYLYGTDLMLPGASELSAVLACGPDAWIRRRSALSLLKVITGWQGDVEVTALGGRRSRPGIAVHRMAELAEVDRGFASGIPAVSPALALLEFANVAKGDELERAIAEAYFLKLVSEEQLRGVLTRHAARAGAVALREELERIGGPQWTESEGERRMKLLLRKAGLPAATTRVKLAGFRADFFWREFGLIVEFDGYQGHGSRYAFEHDRRRDQAHIAAGYTVIRVTWRQLEREPYRVVAVIATAIGAARRAA